MAKNNFKSPIYNLSAYVKRYIGKDGTPRGYKFTGYREGEDGKRERVTLWHGSDGVTCSKGHDGNVYIKIRLADLEDVADGKDKKPAEEGGEGGEIPI